MNSDDTRTLAARGTPTSRRPSVRNSTNASPLANAAPGSWAASAT